MNHEDKIAIWNACCAVGRRVIAMRREVDDAMFGLRHKHIKDMTPKECLDMLQGMPNVAGAEGEKIERLMQKWLS